MGIGVAAILVMVYGVLGEILALLALEQGQAMLSTQSTVMNSAIVLIVGATVASVWRIVETFIEAEKKARRARPISSTGPVSRARGHSCRSPRRPCLTVS